MPNASPVNSVRLHFPNHEHADLVLAPGTTGLGRDPDHDRGISVVDAQQDAFIRIVLDRRGLWMTVAEGVWGVHVNGRPVQQTACLHVGDSLHLEGMEVVLVRDVVEQSTENAFDDAEHSPVLPRPVLRGLNGPLHGQAQAVSAREAWCPIIDLFAQQGLQLRDVGGRIRVRAQEPEAWFQVNGQQARDVLLESGDQVRLADGQRLLVESPGDRVVVPVPHVVAAEDSSERGTPRHTERWSFLWILGAALMIAVVLMGVFWFGA